MREFKAGLPTILPVYGEAGYRWREEEYRASLDTIDGILIVAALAMVRYKKTCNLVVAARIEA